MAQDAFSLRRRAALAALRPVLDDNALIEALWDLQENMRGDGVSDVISYIDGVSNRHMLDARTTKRLYEIIFRSLKTPDGDLPDDPWPAMQASRAVRSAPAVSPQFTFNPTPVPPPQVAAPATVPAPPPAASIAVAPASAPVRQLPPEQAVFSGLIRAILAEVQQFHSSVIEDFRTDSLKELGKLRVSGQAKHDFKQAWLRPLQDEWQISATATELAELMHLIYIGLCESIGPVEADQVLARALRSTERLPEARSFSPKRFL
ncbi:MAG: hypothetical protein AB3X44_08810 [Leptothrix sp. (in: b-proteobacteria)]